jgi:DNA (cytosine-5)-methyltransferase 1
MGMPWANRDGLREAIPPAYSQYVGQQLMAAVVAA